MRSSTIPLAILVLGMLSSAVPFITSRTLDDTPGGAGQSALFEQACATAGLEAGQVGLDPGDLDLWGGGKYAPPLLKTYMDDPWKISPYTRTITAQLLQSAAEPAKVLMALQARTGHGVRLGLTDDVLAPYLQRVTELGQENLAVALSELTGESQASFAYRQGDYSAIPARGARRCGAVLFRAARCVGLPARSAGGTTAAAGPRSTGGV